MGLELDLTLDKKRRAGAYAPAPHSRYPPPVVSVQRVYAQQSPNGNRISKLITAVYKVNRQDNKTRDPNHG